MHSASDNFNPFFANTLYENPHFSNSSSGWNLGQAANLPIPAGQHPIGVASYFSADSNPNAYIASHPGISFTPQITPFQATKSSYLAQVPKQSSPNHDVNVEECVTDEDDSEGDSEGGSERLG